MDFRAHRFAGMSSIALAVSMAHFADGKAAGANKKASAPKTPPAPPAPAPAAGTGQAPGTVLPFVPPPASPAPAPAAFSDDDIDVQLIADILAADAAGMYAPLDKLAPMKHFGYVEVNEGAKDGEGNVAVRITDAGRAWCVENVDTGDGTTDEAPEPNGGFVIDTDVAMPTGRDYNGRQGKYPFEKLEVGHSFHIPATEAAPQPNAKYGSAVTSANKRFAEANKPNKFKIRAVGADDPRGKGARVFRVE